MTDITIHVDDAILTVKFINMNAKEAQMLADVVYNKRHQSEINEIYKKIRAAAENGDYILILKYDHIVHYRIIPVLEKQGYKVKHDTRTHCCSEGRWRIEELVISWNE
jgi:hypothetical protein